MSDIFVCYALYLPNDEIDEGELLEKYGDGKLKLLASEEEVKTTPGILFERYSIEERPAPPDEALAYFGRGFNPEVANLMRESKLVLVCFGVGPFDPQHQLLRDLTKFVGRVANELGAFVFDGADSLSFIPPAFQHIRVAEIEQGELTPDQFGVRAYRVDEGLRSVTMGLEKFGQSNVGIANFAEHRMGKIDPMMTLAMQHIIESDVQVGPGPLELNLASIRNPTIRENLSKHLSGNATGMATINLAPLEPTSGDPKEMLGPVFTSPPGPALWEEQEALLVQLFGAARELSEDVQFDSIAEAVEAARTRALEILSSGEWDADGMTLKLAVTLEETKEVVWLEVISWNEPDDGVGMLTSDPNAAGLTSGQQLRFDLDKVMDFALRRGNEVIASGGVDELVKR
jgi:uncharacterized protein YegJ (DUF2314 family)